MTTEDSMTAVAVPAQVTARPNWTHHEYRIVCDGCLGYEVQIRRWWWPFWIQPRVNTHTCVESAEAWARAHACEQVKYLGRIGA